MFSKLNNEILSLEERENAIMINECVHSALFNEVWWLSEEHASVKLTTMWIDVNLYQIQELISDLVCMKAVPKIYFVRLSSALSRKQDGDAYTHILDRFVLLYARNFFQWKKMNPDEIKAYVNGLIESWEFESYDDFVKMLMQSVWDNRDSLQNDFDKISSSYTEIYTTKVGWEE